MPPPKIRSYQQLFSHAFQNNKSANGPKGIAGLLLFNGPTGLGKTSSLFMNPKNSAHLSILENVQKSGHSSIFITHRWNILNDLYHSLSDYKKSDGSPYTASIVYARDVTFKAAILKQPLPHESSANTNSQNSVSQYPDPYQNLSLLKESCTLSPEFQLSKAYKDIDQIKYLIIDIESIKKGASRNPNALQTMAEQLNSLCGIFEHRLVANIEYLKQQIKQAKCAKEGISIAEDRLKSFCKNPWIQRIFPALKWRLESQDLLIMTTHKFFLSFFDGQSYQRLSKSSLKNYVIFIDELDYQAKELQSLLAEDQPIQELAECLGQIFFDSKVPMRKLAVTHPELHHPLNELRTSFFKALTEKQIPLTENRSLYIPEDLYLKRQMPYEIRYLFKSDQLISNGMIKLVHTQDGYDVYTNEKDIPPDIKTIAIEDFIRIFESYLIKFRRVLLQLEDENDAKKEDQFRQLLNAFFVHRNDNRQTYYSKTIPAISPYLLTEVDLTELKTVQSGNLIPYTYQNINGFTVWAISSHGAQNELDKLRLQTERALMQTTAEALLLDLSARNFVVGLSATAYLDRALNNFDFPWIKSSLSYIKDARTPELKVDRFGTTFSTEDKRKFANRPIPYLESKEDQRHQESLIQFLKAEKEAIRDTKLEVIPTCFNLPNEILQTDIPIFEPLTPEFFKSSLYSHESVSTLEFRKSIVQDLISVCYLVDKNREQQGQIAFVNSFKYFKKWLTHNDATVSRRRVQSLKVGESLPKSPLWKNLSKPQQTDLASFSNDKRECFTHFIQVEDRPIFIWFLDAQCQKKRNFQNAYSASFHLGCPVLIITQTTSASNGINLDYTSALDEHLDLSMIYLVESQHFYFSDNMEDKIQNSPTVGNMSKVSHEIRNLYKFSQKYGLSNSKFSQFIPSLISRKPSNINIEYKKSFDYCLNTMATLQQQIGRLERVWKKQPHSTKLYMTETLVQEVGRFSRSIEYSNHKHLLSHFNTEVIAQVSIVQENLDTQSLIDQFRTKTFPGDTIVDVIDNLIIPTIQNLRKTGHTQEAHYLHQIWVKFGDAILRQQYNWSLLDETKIPPYKGGNQDIHEIVKYLKKPIFTWACFRVPLETTDLSQIWYHPQTFHFYATQKEHCVPYNFTEIYDLITHNKDLAFGFRLRGYVTSSDKAPTYMIDDHYTDRFALHPFMVQRILKGRIGEKAIEIILEKSDFLVHKTLISARTFENYDIAIKNSNFRIDAKFWSQSFLNQVEDKYYNWRRYDCNQHLLFDKKEKNPPYKPVHVESSNFVTDVETDPQKLIDKLHTIRQHEGENTKLVIANLFDHTNNSKLLGYDEYLQPVALDKASIYLLNSVLDKSDPNQLSAAFKTLRTLISNNIHNNKTCFNMER